MPLALVVYLLLFYLLPLNYPFPLYQWVWIHARERLPGMMLRWHGAIVWNGAFYAAMLAFWLSLLVPAVLFQWLSRRDDPEWGGLFAGFGRRNRLAYADIALLVLFPALVVVCLLNGYYVHGPLSAGIITLATLLPGMLPARVRQGKAKTGDRRQETGRQEQAPENGQQIGGEKQAEESDADLPLAARALADDEPPPIRLAS